MTAQAQQSESEAAFGIIGMGTMGSALAQNLSSRGVSVAVWDRDPAFLVPFGRQASPTLEALVARLQRPRKLLLMITAGAPVDAVTDVLLPMLDRGDVLMDGGNSLFLDTQRRVADASRRGIHFCGVGISGGEEGARHGASLMFGGTEEAWALVQRELELMAAQVEGSPCAARVGSDGAGHFVKTVHNGIEYADLQLLAETYDLLRKREGRSASQIADLFDSWRQGPLSSFLLDNAVRVLRRGDDETGGPLVDQVMDRAAQKGTGRWTVEAALALGVPVPSIAQAVDARLMSSKREERLGAAKVLGGPRPPTGTEAPLDPRDLHDALLGARIVSYAQGFALISAASRAHGWNTPLEALARIWRGGCIIRSVLLGPIRDALLAEPELPNLLLAPALRDEVLRCEPGWRRTLAMGVMHGVPMPVLGASLAYFDAYRSDSLPQNLTQAQRDAFGAHTYERVDREGSHHTDW